MDQKDSLKTIYVEWFDPHSVDPWTGVDDMKDDLALIKSFGFLIRETEKALVIALNYDPGEESVSCAMIIPKAAIKLRYEGKMVMREVKCAKKKK